MQKIEFENDGYDFLISSYTVVGPRLNGMNDKKIFIDKGKYFKNHEGNLLLVDNFSIFKDSQELEKHEYIFDTKTRVAAGIIYDESVLLLQRVRPDREYFVYPGGHVKQNEDYLSAIKREIKEETNIDLSVNDFELILDRNEPGYGPEKFYYARLSYMTEIFDKNPELPTGDGDLGWYTINEAKSLQNLFPLELIEILDTKSGN